MTKKLFYTSPKTSQWESKIQQCFKENDYYYIKLDETAFYPEGGGQPSDKGTIDGLAVLDIIKEADGDILHKLEERPGSETVQCELDWARRFDHMQSHSGQHLLSAVCRELFDANTVSFHLGKEYLTIDITESNWTEVHTTAAEEKVNQYIIENLELLTYYVTKEELQTLPIVKMPKVSDNIRIVEIKGIEYNPCGGTHVERTGEIGMIKILKTEKQKEHTRLYFKCGFRALNDYSESLGILSALTNKFNTGRAEILNRIEKLENDYKQLLSANEHLKLENAKFLADSLLAEENEEGFIHHLFEECSLKELQNLAATIAKKEKVLVLLASLKDQKVVLSNSGPLPIHCGQYFKAQLSLFNGKGGGSEQTAQAGFNSQHDLQAFYQFTIETLLQNSAE
ncbi:hydrolase [Peribacillus muralis]|uniref:alanyl-tRNA editing protein n=1 Tax=Peribacillus muralis TaxID=264697 RepID=UPI001F4E3CBB|nr:DHHA1 domain-containing protein [Peribacillus muralis]MCK1991030.1 DHHA1 domain-containing protein [Peribacillus muralis]MCK2011584.1 DHHA1 domain-containing protein [Peribacillus muralis]